MHVPSGTPSIVFRRVYFTCTECPRLKGDLLWVPFACLTLGTKSRFGVVAHGEACMTVPYRAWGVSDTKVGASYTPIWRCLRLAMPHAGDSLSRRCSILAASPVGNVSFGRCLRLAMPLLGDAYVWRRLTPLWVFVFYLFTPLILHFEWEEKNWGKVFLNFFFTWVTSLKNPREGKRVSPLIILLHCCSLHNSTKIKFQIGRIPAARNGTPLQSL